MTTPRGRVAVIGGGPIGLEAALLAAQSGFDVRLYERSRVAANITAWGHVRLFSPFGMNCSEWGRAALRTERELDLPAEDALLTGREYVRDYLTPLSRLPILRDRIAEHTEVRAIGRRHLWKGDLIGDPQRGRDPFQLLLEDDSGQRMESADFLLDCSGTYPHHNWLGAGGIPCVGEHAAAGDITYEIPDILGAQRRQFAHQNTLVVGSGYSAATAICSLAQLAAEEPRTRCVWVTRSDRALPIERIPNDALTERDRLAATANRWALAADRPVNWRPGRLVRSIRGTSAGGFCIELANSRNQPEELVVDRVIANVGYRPQRQLYEELQIHECYATGGPMKLAAALLGETSADCLRQPAHGAETLRNPEPNYFILGSKSYGRDSRFLLKTGFDQIREAVSLLRLECDRRDTGD